MEIELRKIVIPLIAIAMFAGAFAGTASALGMLNLDFRDVEQGRTYTEAVNIITSARDFDNHFVVEKSGELANWIDVSPQDFDLKAGDTQTLTVTLTIPEDAKLGEYTGAITAAGQSAAPAHGDTEGGAAVGYKVATKSKLRATVIKPGAVEAITILNADAPKRVKPGSVAKIEILIKNTGNVPATASPTLTVSKGEETVATIPGVPLELSVDEEKTVKLYWEAQEQGLGFYTAVVAVTCGETTTTSDPVSIEVGKSGFSLPAVPVFAVVAAILAAVLLLRHKRGQRRKR